MKTKPCDSWNKSSAIYYQDEKEIRAPLYSSSLLESEYN